MFAALPEIRENAATADIAALYADVRAVTGVPMVNLIYRHIATVPNGLAWVWSIVRPHIVSGTVASLAQDVLRVAAATDWGEPSPLAKLPASERGAITPILQWYNRGNAVNLVILRALRAAKPEGGAPRGETGLLAVARDPEATPPPPLSLGEVEPALRERIATLCERQQLSSSGVTPTMYLHLARWPAALEPILAAVERAMDREVVLRGAASLVAAADLAVHSLAASFVAYEEPPDPAGRAAIDAALETFSTKAIPQMLTVGAFLLRE